jgi:hypothetical protein
MSTGSRSRQKTVFPYACVAVVAGAAFGIVAVLDAPAISYVIIAILAGAGYSLVRLFNRRRDRT